MRALIFDCYGVLILNRKEFFENISKNSAQRKSVHDLFCQFDFGMISKDDIIAELAEILDIKEDLIATNFAKNVFRNEKMLDFLRKEKLNGSKILILSNVAQFSFDELFSKQEQIEMFDEVLLSGNLGVSKPQSRAFEIAIQIANLPPENCIMIDDSRDNILSAKSLGMRGIIYDNFEDFLLNFNNLEEK